MGSETTAAATGAVGVVRRDPFAMLPFCGYNMGDYFGHWLKMGAKSAKAPKVFHVNWFRKDKNGKFLWPGFGQNMRVLQWVLERCEGKGAATTTPIGHVPAAGAISTQGLDVSPDQMKELLAVDKTEWATEAKGIAEFFGQFGDRLPAAMKQQLDELNKRLA